VDATAVGGALLWQKEAIRCKIQVIGLPRSPGRHTRSRAKRLNKEDSTAKIGKDSSNATTINVTPRTPAARAARIDKVNDARINGLRSGTISSNR